MKKDQDPSLKLTLPVREFLHKPNIGILATLRKNGTPHLTAVWYLYENDEVWLTITDQRMKTKHIERDNRVSLAIANNSPPYKEVVLEGTAIIEAEGGDEFFRRIAVHYYGETDGNAYADYDAASDSDRRLVLHYRAAKIMVFDFEHEDDYHNAWGQSYDLSFQQVD